MVDEQQVSGLQSPMSDGTIEEDFEKALAKETKNNSMLDRLNSPSRILITESFHSKHKSSFDFYLF
jgi:hypothetical protein